MVRAHARALLASDHGVRFLDGDLRDPAPVLAATREFLDFTQPVAVLLVVVLHFPRDSDAARAAVRQLTDADAALISHVTTEGTPDEIRQVLANTYRDAPSQVLLRDRDDITSVFGDLPLVDPGLVSIDETSPLCILGGIATI
jgi:hypothetical protein